MTKKRSAKSKGKAAVPPPQIPAVPPPDNPLRRAAEFDPEREYKSREMAEKRLEAIQKTRKMPTAAEEPVPDKPDNADGGEPDTT